MYGCFSCMYILCACNIWGGQKRASDSMKLGLQMIVSASLGAATQTQASARAVSSPNYWAIFSTTSWFLHIRSQLFWLDLCQICHLSVALWIVIWAYLFAFSSVLHLLKYSLCQSPYHLDHCSFMVNKEMSLDELFNFKKHSSYWATCFELF